jgi:hypothetical protein
MSIGINEAQTPMTGQTEKVRRQTTRTEGEAAAAQESAKHSNNEPQVNSEANISHLH